MTDALDDRIAKPRPVWAPIALACKSCKHEWDDWQPWNVPVDTWVAHVRTYRCPQCGVADARRLRRVGRHGTAGMTGQGSADPLYTPPTETRLILTDDGTRILLTVYPADSPSPIIVELSAERAVRLCAELSTAAARHLARGRLP